MCIALIAAVLFVLFARGASGAPLDWEAPAPAEWIALAAVEGLIVADVLQTRVNVNKGTGELNPFLGMEPSTERLFAMGALGMLVTASAFYFAPSPWRDFVLAGVGGAEVGVLLSNNGVVLRVPF